MQGIRDTQGHPAFSTETKQRIETMTAIEGAQPITHSDILDSQEIIARIEYLESAADTISEEEFVEDGYREELDGLKAFADEAINYVADWVYGETIIADDYFQDYAEEMAYDIGAIDRNATWPLNRIDWEAAADDLKIDYSEVELTLDGQTRSYWIR